jgi:multisubunit Na+/H+ antiporter MnhF subunit
MNVLTVLALIFIVLALVLCVVRLFLGPTTPDRVVAADSAAVITTAGLAWLAHALDSALYLDIALVYGALAFIGVVAIARAMEAAAS